MACAILTTKPFWITFSLHDSDTQDISAFLCAVARVYSYLVFVKSNAIALTRKALPGHDITPMLNTLPLPDKYTTTTWTTSHADRHVTAHHQPKKDTESQAAHAATLRQMERPLWQFVWDAPTAIAIYVP